MTLFPHADNAEETACRRAASGRALQAKHRIGAYIVRRGTVRFEQIWQTSEERTFDEC